MTNEQLIAKFNPASAEQLTAEDLEFLRGLTDDQIDTLAAAYPNTPQRRSYLRLYDTKIASDKQIFQLSTWQNLRNVRKFANQKNLRPYDFLLRGNKLQTTTSKPGVVKAMATSPRKVVVDLTAQQAADELKNSLVDKSPAPETKPAPVKAAKPAAGKGSKAAKAPKKEEAAVVENSSLPDDQTFGSGE
jgi:hypothetical protein